MKLIALKTKDGEIKGDIAFYCRVLRVSRQGFYQYLANQNRPWKYQPLADAMMEILKEDTCNDTYGRVRMYQALTLKQPENVDIPSERTVYRIMEEIGISHHPRRKLLWSSVFVTLMAKKYRFMQFELDMVFDTH